MRVLWRTNMELCKFAIPFRQDIRGVSLCDCGKTISRMNFSSLGRWRWAHLIICYTRFKNNFAYFSDWVRLSIFDESSPITFVLSIWFFIIDFSQFRISEFGILRLGGFLGLKIRISDFPVFASKIALSQVFCSEFSGVFSSRRENLFS